MMKFVRFNWPKFSVCIRRNVGHLKPGLSQAKFKATTSEDLRSRNEGMTDSDKLAKFMKIGDFFRQFIRQAVFAADCMAIDCLHILYTAMDHMDLDFT